MKINTSFFWTFSICIFLLSCYLFQKSLLQLYQDGDYMESLHLSADADTPSVAIAGTVVLTYVASVAHFALLLTFLIIEFLKGKEILVTQQDLLLNIQNVKPIKFIFQLAAYLLTIYWIWDLFQTTQVKFFWSLVFFTSVAIVVT